MSGELQKFSEAASDYCIWVEGPANTPDQDVVEALRHITLLYRLALELPDLFGEEEEPEILEKDRKRIVRRLSDFPLGPYAVCFNPLEIDEPAVVGSIADDLHDIWHDLIGGVALYKEGHHSAAAWHWRFHFMHHWGRHAVSAISALHAWLTENPSAMPSNKSFKADAVNGAA